MNRLIALTGGGAFRAKGMNTTTVDRIVDEMLAICDEGLRFDPRDPGQQENMRRYLRLIRAGETPDWETRNPTASPWGWLIKKEQWPV